MKLLQCLVLFTAVTVDAASHRRLRRGAEEQVNTKYLDLASHVDENTKHRVARHHLNLHADTDAARSERHMAGRKLQDMSLDGRVEDDMSMRMSMDDAARRRHLQDDTSMRMSL